MATALAFISLIALIAFAFFLMWGMPRIFKGHHNDGDSVGSTTYVGHDSVSHSDAGSHSGSDGGGGGSH